MRDGECIITLQDVAVQLGLLVDGEPVTGLVHYDWKVTSQLLLSVTLNDSHIENLDLVYHG